MAQEEQRFDYRRRDRDAFDEAGKPASACIWRCRGEYLRGGPAQLGDVKAQEKEKRAEETGKPRDDKKKSLLASVSAGLPGLIEAGKISSKAAHVGFEWPQIEGLFEKLSEETA